MSMSTHVVGFRPPDEKWQKMKAIWDACMEADVCVPDIVSDFFEGEPDENGMMVSLPTTDWQDDACQGKDLNVSDIPDSITIIRFYNSW